jgi:hypothetical protein
MESQIGIGKGTQLRVRTMTAKTTAKRLVKVSSRASRLKHVSEKSHNDNFNRLIVLSEDKKRDNCQSSIFYDFRHLSSLNFFAVTDSLAHLLFDLTSLSIPGIVMHSMMAFCARFFQAKPVSNQFYSVNPFLPVTLIFVCLSAARCTFSIFSIFRCGIG